MKTFSEKVLDVVKKIPRGKTMTYAQVAKATGSPKAFRAVGSLTKANYNTQIPCHRVIRSDGRPGQYNRGGETAKRKLLEQEKTSK